MLRTVLVLVSTVVAVSAVTGIAVADEKTVSLFNGKDLAGWEPYLWNYRAGDRDTQTPPSEVWTVKDGVLICKGRPTGYLRTQAAYKNYQLTLEWRFPKGGIGGNSGVLVHATTPQALGQWPRSIEVQLYRGNAGDFWVIPLDTKLKVDNEAARRNGRRYRNLTDDSEHPIGEWNEIEITCRGDEIIVKVNGELVNHATNCSVQNGAICLQSEGAEIHFRNLVLVSLGGHP